ncbi:hypothetical protein B0O99DRAFT_527591, partial [Bisporella sp. PMI_857]
IFITPCDSTAKETIPSLVFVTIHPGIHVDGSTSLEQPRPIRFMFDLGIRFQNNGYTIEQRLHPGNQQLVILGPDLVAILSEEGIQALTDIDFVVLRHVHYGHHRDPEFFMGSTFIVGYGSTHILQNGLGGKALTSTSKRISFYRTGPLNCQVLRSTTMKS